MQAAFMTGPGQFTIKEVPEPIPGPGDVILRVRACAVCGSDLTLFKMGLEDRILGHEFAGEIVGREHQMLAIRSD